VDIRVLRAADVRALLPMSECIDLMQRTMIAVSEGRAVLPLRSILVMPGDRGRMGNMPGYLADPECFGIKLVSLMPRNKPPLFSSHLGVVLLFESEHGQPVESELGPQFLNDADQRVGHQHDAEQGVLRLTRDQDHGQ